jgi:hypothetical protein
MVQAEQARAVRHDPRPPVVIWRKLRARSLCVTCQLGLLTQLWILGESLAPHLGSSVLVHLDFEDWFRLVKRWLDAHDSRGTLDCTFETVPKRERTLAAPQEPLNELLAQTQRTDDNRSQQEVVCLPSLVTPLPAR